MKKLYIFGASYFDFKAVDAINRIQPTWDIIGFVDIRKFRRKLVENYPYPFLGGVEKLSELAQHDNNYFFHNERKHSTDYAKLLNSQGCNIAEIIHPGIDMNLVEIGQGCMLSEGCAVGGYTKIGNFVKVRMKSIISHNVLVEDHVFIGPGATIGGGAVLKQNCFIGVGAVVMGHRTVGEGSLVGAGAVVTKDVTPGTVVVGIPARPMKGGS